jgi:hypothetical protein
MAGEMMKAWLKVVGLGLAKWPMKLAAPFVVPFLSDFQRLHHPIFGVRDALESGDLSWRNIAIRNGCHNMFTVPQPDFHSWGDEDMEAAGFKYRYRRAVYGDYVSFRMTWGAARPVKGKREFYVGWTMNDRPYARLTFFQLRLGIMDYQWKVGKVTVKLWPFVWLAACTAALLWYDSL